MLDITVRPATVIPPGGGEVLDALGAPMIVKADGGTPGPFFAEHPVPPGYAVPPHVHAVDDELFYILEGELTLLTDGGEVKAGPGATVLLPRGGRHGFRNDTAGTVRMLVVCTPGLQAAEMFRHFDRARPTAPDAVVGICAQYGVAF